jgi:hypothetical protein
MVDGSVSVYEHTSKGGWDETITLTKLSDGVYREVDTPNPDQERNEAVLEVDSAGRVFRISKEVYIDDILDTLVEYDPGFLRFDPAWLELEANVPIREGYDRTESHPGEAPDPTRARAHIYTSFGFQSLAVLGTAYNNCLTLQRARDYEDTTGDAEDQQKVFYFCPNVGKVQEVNVDSGNTEQLVSYSE